MRRWRLFDPGQGSVKRGARNEERGEKTEERRAWSEEGEAEEFVECRESSVKHNVLKNNRGKSL